MPTPATAIKRQQLQQFIDAVLAPEPSVKALIIVGSVATGVARPDSDIDGFLLLDPYDDYVVPAEFLWRPSDGSFTGIFDDEYPDSIQLDLTRRDFDTWADPERLWDEGERAALAEGWLAFDRTGTMAEVILERTAYDNTQRLAMLDAAIVAVDHICHDDSPARTYATLGPLVAHDRISAAYDDLVGALFAYNRRWLPWRARRTSYLLDLPWLPERFGERAVMAVGGEYGQRVASLKALYDDLIARLEADGTYGDDPISEAFIRTHDEPGRSWNMAEWNARHAARGQSD